MPNRQGNVTNPDGKGGFGENPQNRNPGGWKPEHTISYQYRRYMAMSAEEFNNAAEKEDMSMAMKIAYNQVKGAMITQGLHHVKEITDRTEGKAPQSIDISNPDGSLNPYSALSADELRKLIK